MTHIVVGKENTQDIKIYFKDWGSGQPIVFSHGWPLTADAWDDQLMFFARHGYRAIARQRRGGGRPRRPWAPQPPVAAHPPRPARRRPRRGDRDARPARRRTRRPLDRRRRGDPLRRAA